MSCQGFAGRPELACGLVPAAVSVCPTFRGRGPDCDELFSLQTLGAS